MIMLESRKLQGAALSLAVLTLVAVPKARADSIFKMMGINIGIENQIDYHERPPLVVPPNNQLPPPQPPGSAQTQNWPADLDAARKKDLEKRKKLDQTFDYDQFTRPLPPSQVGPAGGVAPSPPPSTTASVSGTSGSGGDMTATAKPSELGSPGGFFSFFKGGGSSSSEQKQPAFTGEKPRQSLLDPPVGYRTPSASQPYGEPKPADPYGKPKTPADIPAGDAQP
jgi:hypothetical protein